MTRVAVRDFDHGDQVGGCGAVNSLLATSYSLSSTARCDCYQGGSLASPTQTLKSEAANTRCAQALMLPEAVRMLHLLLSMGKRVYVHCTAGINRATLTVVGYLTFVRGWPLEDAVNHVKHKRPQAHPYIDCWQVCSLHDMQADGEDQRLQDVGYSSRLEAPALSCRQANALYSQACEVVAARLLMGRWLHAGTLWEACQLSCPSSMPYPFNINHQLPCALLHGPDGEGAADRGAHRGADGTGQGGVPRAAARQPARQQPGRLGVRGTAAAAGAVHPRHGLHPVPGLHLQSGQLRMASCTVAGACTPGTRI